MVITSRQNHRVKHLRAAFADNRADDGLVAIEGEHLLEEAVRSGIEVAAVFNSVMEQEFLAQLNLPATVEKLTLNDDVFSSAVATRSPQGVAALVRPRVYKREDLLGDVSMIVIAAGLQDPGNLGTLVRTAEAFGATGMLTTENTVDAWNQKSLRSSAGSVFRLPMVQGCGMDDLEWLRTQGVRLLAAVATGGKPAHLSKLASPIALMIGNEGAGLSQEMLSLADEHITLPCPGAVESLNAAIAGSVLLYEASRQRGIKNS